MSQTATQFTTTQDIFTKSTPISAFLSSCSTSTYPFIQRNSKPPTHSSATNASTTIPSSQTEQSLLKRRRRTSSLFGKKPFRFSISRTRRESNNTNEGIDTKENRTCSSSSLLPSPPISPKTRTCPAPPAVPGDGSSLSLHRKTIVADSVNPNFPFGKLVPNGVRRGRDLGSVYSDISLSPDVFHAHPGTLVNFCSNIENEGDVYGENSPRSTSSNSSFPTCGDKWDASREYHQSPRIQGSKQNAENTGKENTNERRDDEPRPSYFQVFDSTMTTTDLLIYSNPRTPSIPSTLSPTFDNTDYKATKLARKVEAAQAQSQIQREGLILIPHSSTILYPDGNGRVRDRRKVSAASSASSSDSAEVFLNHVRKSFESRRNMASKRASYDVFKDEAEKGFLEGSF